MNFGLEEHQDQLLRASEQWLNRSWSAGDRASPDGRRALWSEVVANGWAGMLESELGSASVLDAALLVERLAMGGCSLPIVGGGLIAPLVAEVAGIDLGDANVGLLAFEAGSAETPTARGLDIADTVIAVRWTTGPDPDAGADVHEPAPRWQVAAFSIDQGPGLVTLQREERFELSGLADPVALTSAAWQTVDPLPMTRIWQIGAVLSAAELVGLGRAVLDQCVSYAGVREQGGKPIGGHQAVQHRLADMLACVDRSRYITYVAAAGLAADSATDDGGSDNGAPKKSAPKNGAPADRSSDGVAVHQAKALAARDCLVAIRSAHQVMGAISFSAEHELHHFHKQAVLAANEFGSANHHWRALERA
ncbi:MAG: acyl-CoA dehydrogenase family protein [Acidimicrobiales bacterium]